MVADALNNIRRLRAARGMCVPQGTVVKGPLPYRAHREAFFVILRMDASRLLTLVLADSAKTGRVKASCEYGVRAGSAR